MSKISRRDATKSFLYAIAGTAIGTACGGGETSNSSGGSSGTGSSGTASGSSGSSGASSSGAASSSGGSSGAATSSSGGSSSAWASGGTAAMTAAASYPDPFAGANGACTLYVTATAGPCTEAADQVRKDISEGAPGLPLRIALRFVDSACNPIANAKVKIWHTENSGSYTGQTPNQAFCVTDPAQGQNHSFRGVQTTDSNGRVDFDSCFPGWYAGRAIHIHFTVSTNVGSFTSQLIFDDTLVDEIFTTHVDYKSYGLPDTHNTNDGIVSAGNVSAYTMTVARMTDGAMLASKLISANLS